MKEKKDMSYEEVFSERSIIRALVKLRLKVAQKRRHKLFLYGIAQNGVHPAEGVNDPVCAMMPPRRAWKRPYEKSRKGCVGDDVLRKTLMRTIDGVYFKGTMEREVWGRELMKTVREIRALALDPSGYVMGRPEIREVRKGRSAASGMRHICVYPLYDQVIASLLAGYLRGRMEPVMPSCVYGMRKDATYDHHEAVRRVVTLRKECAGDLLFVAECDVRSFFDVLHHDVVRAARDACFRELEQSDHPGIDQRASVILDRMLDSFSFSRDVLRDGKSLPWSGECDSDVGQIGIPQGSPLSGVLVHMVMLEVDRVMDSINRMGGCYIRYVDDMVVMHQNQTVCREYFEQYLISMRALKLPVHKPVAGLGDAEMYAAKSKDVYAWSVNDVKRLIFLGYDIDCLGRIRVRKQSLKKETVHIRELSKKIQYEIVNGQKAGKNVGTIGNVLRIRQHLNMRIVGRRNLMCQGNIEHQPCWADGFLLLKDENMEPLCNALRTLDRIAARERKNILTLLLPDGALRKEDMNFHRYDGAPFSYYGALHDSSRRAVRCRFAKGDRGFEGYR
jgi:hypothetical protein